ncbi:MAG TPA: RHS repeat-associated core domain-containing protein, partial [Herpetosiphonaceae bacterium]
RLDDFPPLYRAGYFDGSFSQRGPRVLLGTHPDQSLGGTTAAETVFDLPAGAQSMAFSANVRGGMFSSGLAIYVKPAGAADWGVAIAAWDFHNGADSNVSGSVPDGHVQLLWSATPGQRYQIKLRCATWNGYPVTCGWTKLKFYHDVPGWTRAPLLDSNHEHTARARWGVHSAAEPVPAPAPPVAPRDGEFLAVQTLPNPGGGSYAYLAPPLALPPFASGDLTVAVSWTQRYPDPLPGGVSQRAPKLRLTLSAPDAPETSLVVNAGDERDAAWRGATLVVPAAFQDRIVRLSLGANHTDGGGPSVVALDDLKFFYKGRELAMPIAPDGSVGKCSCAVMGGSQWFFGDPVNTFSGAFVLDELDASLPTDGSPFDVTRGYASLLADTSIYPVTSLGPGWRGSFQETLTLPASTGGEPATAIYETAQGNRVRFFQSGPASFKPAPGVRAALALIGDQYKLTAADTTALTFDRAGRLLTVDDPHGRRLIHSYGQDGYKERVTHNASGRNLRFSYVSRGGKRLQAVDLYDQETLVRRLAAYDYDAAGYLIKATDAQGAVINYGYAAGPVRRLDRIWRGAEPISAANPAQVINEYYPNGKVRQQTEASGRVLAYRYDFAGDKLLTSPYVTTITVTPPAGSGEQPALVRHHYRADGTPRMQEQNGRFLGLTALRGAALAPARLLDGNLNAVQVESNPSGLPTKIIDPQGGALEIDYDSANRPLEVTQPDGVRQAMTYDAAGNLRVSQLVPAGGGAPSATRMTYTDHQRLRTVTAPDGVVTLYEYNAKHQVSHMIVGYGTAEAKTTVYGYDAAGRLTDVLEGAGTPLATTTRTEYRPDGQVRLVIQNYRTPGAYDPADPLRNVRTEYGYDSRSRQIWTKTVDGRYHGFTHYDAAGRVDWIVENPVDSAGAPVAPAAKPAYDPARPDANILTEYGYDGLGRRATVTRHGFGAGAFQPATRTWSAAATRVTLTEYDSQDRPVKVTENYQPGQPVNTLPAVNVQTETIYDGVGNVTWQRDAAGLWTRFQYDSANRPTTTIRNYENGDPLTVADWSHTDGSDTDLVSQTVYHAQNGRVLKSIENMVDGNFDIHQSQPITDHITIPSYDAFGRVTATLANAAPASSGIGGVNRETRAQYDPATGRLLATRDAAGVWTVLRYDALGRQSGSIRNCVDAAGARNFTGCLDWTSVAPDRNVPGPQTRFDARWRPIEMIDAMGIVTRQRYDALGRVEETISNYVAGGPSDSATNVSSTTAYDALGRVAQLRDADGNLTSYAYNGLGQRTAVTDPELRVTQIGYDADGAQRWIRSNDGRFTVIEVDGLGREVRRIVNYENGVADSADGSDRDLATRTVYDLAGNVQKLIDPQNQVTLFGYDHLRRLAQVTENAVPAQQCLAADTDCNAVTRYRYDRLGNRIAVTDARGYVRRFEFNAANEQTAATDPLGNRETRAYDANGRLVETLLPGDAAGATARLIAEYDSLGRRTALFPATRRADQLQRWAYDILGRVTAYVDLASPAGSDATLRYDYDALGRVKNLTDPRVGTTSYAYEPGGQRRQITYPNRATVVDFAYYGDGRLKTVRQGGAEWAEYLYDAAGRLQTLRRNNDALVTTWAYDNADRPIDVITQQGGATKARFEYTVDRGGKRLQVTDTVDGARLATAYQYDRLGRLTVAQEGGGARAEYGYDRAGNRTSVIRNGVGETFAFNAANQVVKAGWRYDGRGNLLADGSRTYAYDDFGRLRTVVTGSGAGARKDFGYHGEALVTGANDGALVARFAQDFAAPMSQLLESRISAGPSTSFIYGSERLGALSGSARAWHVADALGSVHAQLTDAGAVQSRHQFDAWGQSTGANAPAPWGFAGEYASSNGLVYLRARWYNPAHGALLGKDPFEGWATKPNSLHPYQYAANNPLSNIDPSGRCYGPIEFLRSIETQNCVNLDTAISIYQHPKSSFGDKAQAASYVTAWMIPHAMLLLAAGLVLTQGVISVAAVVEWGAVYLASTGPAAATATAGVAGL